MATMKTSNQIPGNYLSPFKRVQMEERIDDALACIATITNQDLASIKKLAIQHGLPEHGPAWVDNDLIAKCFYQYGLVSGQYLETNSIDALPDVALVLANYNPATEIGRHVVWHHCRGDDKQTAFSYVIDPAGFIDPKNFITGNFAHLKFDQKPLYYIAVTQRPDMKYKGK